jgi:hypothetical protein
MLLLTSTSDKLQVVTSAAVSLDVQASYVDVSGSTVTTNRQNTVIVTATTTDVVPSPAASTARNVKHVSARARGGANTVTIKHTDGTNPVELIKVALLQDETLVFNDGTGFQVFDATGAVKNAFAPAGGRYIKTTVYSSGSANHTTDAKASKLKVRLVAGGGGGGGCSSAASSAACGGGGGGGGYAEKDFDVSPSTAYAYAVGAAGSAGANTGGTGGTGGNSTFTVGGVTVTAFGGAGGVGMAAATTADSLAGGGAGGATSTNGDVNGAGHPGDYGIRRSGTIAVSGNGGSTRNGGGGVGRTAAGVGNAGNGEGAGGGGGLVLNASAAVLGGAGASGVIIVEEYT